MLIGHLPPVVHAEIVKTTVYKSGTEGYNIFRIPTMVKASNGDLLAFAEARASTDDAGSVDIVVKRSTNNGTSWGPLQLIMDNADFAQYLPPGYHDITLGNHAPVVDLMDPVHAGRIWMPFSMENDRIFATYSDDHGLTWSSAAEVTATAKPSSFDIIQPGPVHSIQLERGEHAGRLLTPVAHRRAPGSGTYVMYSDDHGQSWQVGATSVYSGAAVRPNETVAVELVDGRVYFNSRDSVHQENGVRSINYSSDGGLTFDGDFTKEAAIATSVSQNSALRFRAVDRGDDHNVILYASPGDVANGYRANLVIHASLDETLSWTQETLIHTGRVAYTDLVKLDPDTFGVLYETGVVEYYESIMFASIGYDDLAPPSWNGITGDVNQDGTFDAHDLARFIEVWKPGTGNFYENDYDSYTNGDLSLNGFHDMQDVAIMRSAVLEAGISIAPLSALFQIPEPSSAIVLLTFLALSWPALGRRSSTSSC